MRSVFPVAPLVAAAVSMSALARSEPLDDGTVAPSRWSAGVEGYGGILNQWTNEADRSHAFGGGALRLRYRFLQAGAFMDVSDTGEASGLLELQQERFRTLGGFAGAWVQRPRFVDIDAAIGLASRRYLNPSGIYGRGGLSVDTATLSFRLGVSDRAPNRAMGVRVGAALVASVDLAPQDVTWRRTYLLATGEFGETTGTTRVGGISIGLIVVAGFEVQGR